MVPTILYAAAALLPVALAQNSVITALYTGYETQTLSATLIDVVSSKTTLSLGAFPRQTLVLEGTTSYSADASDPNTDFTYTQQCVLGPKSAVCEESAGGSEANFPGQSTTTYEASELGAIILSVTGDANKLSMQTNSPASASATSTGSAQTGGKSESMASVTKIVGTTTPSASVSRSASGSVASATETGAAPARSAAIGGGLFAAIVGFVGGQLL